DGSEGVRVDLGLYNGRPRRLGMGGCGEKSLYHCDPHLGFSCFESRSRDAKAVLNARVELNVSPVANLTGVNPTLELACARDVRCFEPFLLPDDLLGRYLNSGASRDYRQARAWSELKFE